MCRIGNRMVIRLKRMCAVIAVIVLLCMPRVKSAAIDKVSVIGHGEISAPADTVTVSFSVDVKTASAADSAKKSEAAGKKIVAAVKKYGEVSEESYFSYEDAGCGKWSVSRSYVLISTEPGKIDEICSALTSAGATAICFIGYSISDAKEYQESALKAAVADARERAAVLGDDLGEREIIDYGSCICYCCENPDRRGYVTIECTVNIIYY